MSTHQCKFLREFNKIVQPMVGTRSGAVEHSIPMFSHVYEELQFFIAAFINTGEFTLKIYSGYNTYEDVSVLIGKYVLQLLSIGNMIKVRNSVGQHTQLKPIELIKLEQLLRDNIETCDAIETFLQWRTIYPIQENVRLIGEKNNEIRILIKLIESDKRFSKNKVKMFIKHETPKGLIEWEKITALFLIGQLLTGYDKKRLQFLFELEFDKISMEYSCNDDIDDIDIDTESDDEVDDNDAKYIYDNLCQLTYVKGYDLLELHFEDSDEDSDEDNDEAAPPPPPPLSDEDSDERNDEAAPPPPPPPLSDEDMHQQNNGKVITEDLRKHIFAFQCDIITPTDHMFQRNVPAQLDGVSLKTVNNWFKSSLETYNLLRNKLMNAWNIHNESDDSDSDSEYSDSSD